MSNEDVRRILLDGLTKHWRDLSTLLVGELGLLLSGEPLYSGDFLCQTREESTPGAHKEVGEEQGDVVAVAVAAWCSCCVLVGLPRDEAVVVCCC